MINPATYLDVSARRCPNATLAVYETRRYSYDLIHALANMVANGLLAAGFAPGDRIAVCSANRPGFLAAYYGILKIGGVVVALRTGLKQSDLEIQLRDSGACALFCSDGYGDNAIAEMAVQAVANTDTCRHVWIIPADPLDASTVSGAPVLGNLIDGRSTLFTTYAVAADQTAIIPYTSGTTGASKGVEITHGNIASMALMNTHLAPWEAGRVRFVANPLFHIMGQVASLNIPVMCGQTLVLVERFDPQQAWRIIADEGISYMAGSPLMYRYLLDAASDIDVGLIKKNLRLCGCGAAPLPSEWSDEFEDLFGVPLLPGYGATETTSVVSWQCPTDPVRPGSVGKPIPGVEVRILDAFGHEVPVGARGEIVVRSPGVMKGYFGQPEATARVLRDGWYHTGDIGYSDEEGHLFWLERADNMIVRPSGANVWPAEIEAVILTHPQISQAAVVGRQDDRRGRSIIALLAPKAGAEIDVPSFQRWLAREIPEDQMPDEIEFRPALPVTESGKVARWELMEG